MAKGFGFNPPENEEYFFDKKAEDLGMVLYNIDNGNIAPGEGVLTVINEFIDISNPQEREYLEMKTREVYRRLQEPIPYFFREAEKYSRR